MQTSPDSFANPMPTISVLMPVFNAQKDLRLAIDSILNQSFTDFEFLIIDDGSTDQSAQIFKSYADSRIRFLRNPKNLGLVPTLNRGLSEARGKYIARMDADDISEPLRFESQVALLENDQADICGGLFRVIDAQGKVTNDVSVPFQEDDLIACLANTVPFAHGSVMMRKSFLHQHRLEYGPSPYAEDYDLWIRIFECGGRFVNVPQIIFQYRNYSSSLSKVLGGPYAQASHELRRRFVQKNTHACKQALTSLIKNDSLAYTEQVNGLFMAYLLWHQGGDLTSFLKAFWHVSLKAKLHGLYRIKNA
jgi:glycosyltransferase involved in cell wall biosynthesis